MSLYWECAWQVSSATEYLEDYDVLTVETPENLELRLPLAGFGPRFLALLLDMIFQGVFSVIVFVFIFALAIPASMGESQAASIILLILLLALVVVITFGYGALFEWLWNGQTPGKRIVGIRVVRRGGLPLRPREVLLRTLFRIVDMAPSYGLIGLISFFSTKYQQRLGDLIADTVVIREFTSRQPFSWAAWETSASVRAAGLTPRMSYLIGSYLSRRGMFELEARLDLTEDLIRQLGYNPDPLSLAERDAYLISVMQWQAGAQGWA